MTSFTDSELKRLKELFTFDEYVHRDELFELTKRLIPRLEAAEQALEDADCDCMGTPATCRFHRRMEAWRKSKGELCLDGEPCGEGCGCSEISKGEV